MSSPESVRRLADEANGIKTDFSVAPVFAGNPLHFFEESLQELETRAAQDDCDCAQLCREFEELCRLILSNDTERDVPS